MTTGPGAEAVQLGPAPVPEALGIAAGWLGTSPYMPVAMETLVSDEWLRTAVDALVVLVEAAGALVIVVGAAIAFFQFLRVLPQRDPAAFVPVRLTLGRFLALGLEFQLASDVLRTAVAPSFEELGKLAAVAAIRTALNFFLAREIRDEQATIEHNNERAEGTHDSGSGPRRP